MRLLDRYLLRELLVPLTYCVSGFLLLWVVADLIGELSNFQRYKVGAAGISRYYLLKAPENAAFILPMALLLAMLYALTNHARHQEITAIRAAGVSLWRLCLPYFMVGFAASLVVLGVNEVWVPRLSDTADRIARPATSGNPGREKSFGLSFNNARDRRLWTIGMFDSRSGEMATPIVASTMPDGSTVLLYADRAVPGYEGWVFYNAREYKSFPHTNFPPVLLLKTNLLVRDFGESVEEIRTDIKIRGILNRMIIRGNRKTEIPVTELISYLRLHPDPEQGPALYTKLHGRLATPWTCVVVVLLATPFAAGSGRRNVFMGVAGSILIYFSYYVVQQICLALGAGNLVPPVLAGWLPNLVFGLFGAILMARVR